MNSTGFNYKVIGYQMIGQKFDIPLIKKLKKICKIGLIILIGVAFTLSVIAATKWLTFDTVYTQGVTDTMRAKNGQKIKTTYAGASGEGRIMNAEDKHGH